jgi:hypothetical protein
MTYSFRLYRGGVEVLQSPSYDTRDELYQRLGLLWHDLTGDLVWTYSLHAQEIHNYSTSQTNQALHLSEIEISQLLFP